MNSLKSVNRKVFSYKYKIKEYKNFLFIKSRTVQKYDFFYFSMVLFKNTFSYNRLGIVVSKRVAIAVRRNRMKRLLREIFRLYYSKVRFLGDYSDVYIFIKRDFSCLDMNKLFREFNKFCLEKRLII